MAALWLAVSHVLYKLWNGKYSLAIAFWRFYVGGGIALGIVAFAAMRIFEAQGNHLSYLPLAARLLYLFVSTVGVWRSAIALRPQHLPA
jgi:hypothetical protein